MDQRRVERTVAVFYTTARAGACRLSDEGGPFGFDIAVALLADDLISAYRCDAIAETGCFLGDTTDYLSRRYPELPVYTCDIEPGYCAFTARRLADRQNVTVSCANSPAMLAEVSARHARTFAFLDAHWAGQWPLVAELGMVSAAIVMIHDFDIGHDRFSFDTYDGVPCGPSLLASVARPPDWYFTFDPDAPLPVPCLQTGRRAGVGVLAVGLDSHPLQASPYLRGRRLAPAARRAEALA
jgi:hypothetical protein